jgi:hypothetical protein
VNIRCKQALPRVTELIQLQQGQELHRQTHRVVPGNFQTQLPVELGGLASQRLHVGRTKLELAHPRQDPAPLRRRRANLRLALRSPASQKKQRDETQQNSTSIRPADHRVSPLGTDCTMG